MADVAVAMNSVSNYYGSSSVSSFAGQEVTKNETTVPNYAPEKCMSAETYSLSSDETTNQIAPGEDSNSITLATKNAEEPILVKEPVTKESVAVTKKPIVESLAKAVKKEPVVTKKPIVESLVEPVKKDPVVPKKPIVESLAKAVKKDVTKTPIVESLVVEHVKKEPVVTKKHIVESFVEPVKKDPVVTKKHIVESLVEPVKKKPIVESLVVEPVDLSPALELTEADVFGSQVDDEDLIVGDSSEIAMDTGDSLLSELEAEFSKVTALPAIVKKSVPVKRKAEVRQTQTHTHTPVLMMVRSQILPEHFLSILCHTGHYLYT